MQGFLGLQGYRFLMTLSVIPLAMQVSYHRYDHRSQEGNFSIRMDEVLLGLLFDFSVGTRSNHGR